MNRRASHAIAAAAIALVAASSIAGPVATAASAPISVPAPTSTSKSTATNNYTDAKTNANSDANTAAADDIRDIRGPKGIFPVWQLAALLAGCTLLAIAGYAAWRWALRRSVKTQRRFEIALQQLEDIRALMQPSSVREFSIAISGTVRRYIEDEFKVTATHRTTEEFLHDLLESHDAALAAHRNLLAQFLNQCDLAKFAGVGLSVRIMEALHQSARSFVIESSKPPPAAQAREAPGCALAPEEHDSLPSA